MNEDFSQGSFFERLFRDATEAMVLLDDPDTILDPNQAFTALFGYCAAASLGKSLTELPAGREKDAESGEWTESLYRGEPLHTVAACRHRYGRSIQVHIRSHRFQNPSEYLCPFRLRPEQVETEERPMVPPKKILLVEDYPANLSARPPARAASTLEDLVRKEASEAEIFLALQKIIRESQRLRNHLPAISSSVES